MGKTEKGYECLDGWANYRKEIKESAAEQLYMDNISTGLNESTSISDSWESLSINGISLLLLVFKVLNFYRTILLRIFFF